MRLALLTLILITHAQADWLDRYRSGEGLLNQGNTEDALRELRAALQEAESSRRDGPAVGAILDTLGRAELRAGNYRSAKRYFDRSTGLWGEGTEALATALSNAGQAAQALGEYANAALSFRQALEIMPQRAGLWQLLGGALLLQHHFAEAETAERKALALGDPEIAAVSWNDLAILYQAQHKNRQAADMLELAVAATRPGQSRARMLYNLGTIEWKLGSHKQGEGHLRQALVEMETAVGPHHPDVGKILEDYSMVLRKAGRKPEAKEIAKRAETIRASFAANTNSNRATVDWRDLK